ncbi:MAG: DNA-3-methyladenine glycosylase [Acidimicrobiales bacterium]
MSAKAKDLGAVGLRGGAKRLPRSFAERDPVLVAPELLGKLLQRGPLLARIVEVEAYRGAADAASHAFRGKTPRNSTMFGPPGHLYVYFTYGMHFCANVVCWPEGEAGAVLLRALEPLRGLDEMAARRFARREPVSAQRAGLNVDRRPPAVAPAPSSWRPEALCSGPAKLCQAFGLDRAADGFDLISGKDGLDLLDDGTPAPSVPGVGRRIGLARSCPARDEPWRWWVPGEANVSRHPRDR